MPSLDEIRAALARHQARRISEPGRRRAAVSVVLRDARPGPELLLIERARCEGDPWSGHMAFPGGRVEDTDADPRSAAERETLEEVGVTLDDAEFLGDLDDLEDRVARSGGDGLVISAFVYHHTRPGRPTPNHEVQQVLWVPVRWLHESERRVEYRMPRYERFRFPGILVGEPDRHVVWGLTYRFIEHLFEIVERTFPDRWGELR